MVWSKGIVIRTRLINLLQKLNGRRKKAIPDKQFIILVAIMVGFLSGVAAAVIKAATHYIEDFLQNGLHWRYKYYLYLFFPMVGILLTMVYIRYAIRKSKFETGLSPLLVAISEKSSRLPFHNIYSQIISSAITVGFGGSTGLESPIVISGSSIGSNLGRFFGLGYREVTLLLACGAASAIAGVFNSPIAGIVFAVELLLPEFSIPLFIPLLLSSATAAVTGKFLYNQQLFYLVTQGWQYSSLVFYVITGIAVGFISVYFNKMYYVINQVFNKVHSRYGKAVSGGAALGLMVFLFPTLYGEGYITINYLLRGEYNQLLLNSTFSSYASIPAFIIGFTILTIFFKAIATLVTLKSGGNGGTFAPALLIGALSGFLVGYVVNVSGYGHVNIANFVVAGMAAALSGIMHAPLTGIFLIAEITGGYVLMVPLMITSAISYLISRSVTPYNMYTRHLAESGRLLSHENKDNTVLHIMKLRYVVEKDYPIVKLAQPTSEIFNALISSRKNVYPVVGVDGELLGIIYAEDLIRQLMASGADKSSIAFSQLVKPAPGVVKVTDDLTAVLNKMDALNVWLLPVCDVNGAYMGFVSKNSIFNKYRQLLTRQADYLV